MDGVSSSSTTVTITGNQISGGSGEGIYVNRATSGSLISGNTITHQGHGIALDDCSPPVTNNTITNTTYYPFLQIDNSFPSYSGNTLTGNGRPGIGVNGTISVDGTWSNVQSLGMPYVLRSDMVVNSTLSIEAGVIVKFEYSSSTYSKRHLIINGVLDVQGVSGNPVVFTSNRDNNYGGDTNGDGFGSSPDVGDWGYIEINGPGTVLDYCVIEYGGKSSGGHYMVWIDNIVPGVTISHCRLSHAYSRAIHYEASSVPSNPVITDNEISSCPVGIYVDGVSDQSTKAAIRRNTISDCGTYGIHVKRLSNSSTISQNDITTNGTGIYIESGFPEIHLNNIYDNTTWGINNASGNIINADNNWWGDASGPSGEGPGSGDAVSTDVIYTPWLSESRVISEIFYGDISGDGTISPYDASIALQYAVGHVTLTSYEQEAGDVSDNGLVTEEDGSLILQFTVDLIDHFPAEDSNLSSKLSMVNPRAFVFDFEDNNENGFITIKVRCIGEEPVHSLYFHLQYDASIAHFFSYAVSDSFGEFQFAINDEEGQLRVAMAGTENVFGEMEICGIQFQVEDHKINDFVDSIIIQGVRVNEIPIQYTVTNVSQSDVLPSKFFLNQNYPNPFNCETKIVFGLPIRSNVVLKILDTHGREVRNLLHQYLESGQYDTLWKGTDEYGRAVASGIYFCQIKAGSFAKTIKLLYVQ